LACGIPAVFGAYWFFSPQGEEANPTVRVVVLIAAGVAYLMAAWLFTWPSRASVLTRPLAELPTALMDVKGQMTDLNAIKKEYNRYQSQLEGLVGQLNGVLKGMTEELARRLADLDARQQAFDQMAADRRESERRVSEMKQQVERAADEVKDWEKSVIKFAELLEQTSDPASGLPSEYQRAAERMIGYFAKAFGPFGLQLISPAEGELVDQRVHQVAGTEEQPAIAPGRVVRCVEWGFIMRHEVRKARVIVASEPTAPPPPPTSIGAVGEAVTEPAGGFEPVAVTATSPDATIQRKQTPKRSNPG
jgi:molecular chaperone GrpE (heat shock protein)